MEINDYSTRLAQARGKYNDSTVELRDTYNRDVDRLEKLHEAKQTKQSDNYSKSKQKLENQQADYINEYSAKTKETIEDRTSAYQKNMEREKFSFNEDRNRIKDTFDQRLGELSDTYRVREEESNAYNDHRLKTTKDRYDKQVNRLNDQFQEDLDGVSYRASNSLRTNQNESNKEKRRIITDNEVEKRGLIKEANISKTKMIDEGQKNIQNLRDTHDTSISQIKDHHNLSAKELRKVKNSEQDDLQENFRNLTNEVSNRNQRKRKHEVKENDLRQKNLEKQFADSLYQSKREMNEKLKGGDRNDLVEKKLDRTVASYEDRIKSIYEKVEDNNFNQQIDKERMATSFSNDMKNQKFKAQKDLDVKDKEFRDFRNNELVKTRDKSDLAIGQFKKELNNTEMRAEAQSIKDSQYSKKLLTSQRQAFGDTVNSLSEKNREALSQLQNEHATEKTKFIEQTRKQHHNEIEETKFELKRTMAQKEKSLLERNDQLVKNQEKIIGQYEEKLARLEKKSHKELEKMKEMHSEQNTANKLSVRRQLNAKDRENEFEKVQIKTGYDKRLSRAKDTADKQLEQTVEHYEELLTREREDGSRKFKTKITEMQSDYSKLYQQNELEKATMQQQFQDKIEELRMANSKALEEKAESYKNRKTS
ncbi:MAG: hypothetical protein BM556_13265 [Bacteriovorax sp. MedPE-SWde]|nr:MAG: hypothetical protein BM556_13265 [Bacteriovorax sp. MedPE-SWde]